MDNYRFAQTRRQGIILAGLTLAVISAFTACETRNANTGSPGASNANVRNDNTRSAAVPNLKNVTVRLTEYKIDMPTSLTAGPTIFNVTNAGAMEHNFEIEGQGIENKLPTNLKPGETNTLRVDLKPGAYKIYCPVGDHEDRGMTMQLVVTG